jgi:hypothetical protein
MESVENRVDIDYRARPTLVPLLLDLNLLGQILVLLPLDLMSDSLVVNKVSAITDLLLSRCDVVVSRVAVHDGSTNAYLVVISLLYNSVFKELISLEFKQDLESRLFGIKVFKPDVNEMSKRLSNRQEVNE